MLRGNLGKNWGTPIPEIAQTFLAGGLQRRNLDSSQGFILIDFGHESAKHSLDRLRIVFLSLDCCLFCRCMLNLNLCCI